MHLRFPLLLALLLSGIVALDRADLRSVGDHFQIALPLAGLGCALASGQGVAYLGRYVGLELTLTGLKEGLGAHPLNLRPDGNRRGFPSGHTAAASFGATGLAGTCLAASAPARAVVLLAVGATGTSRVLADRHYVFQVLSGALLGWGAQIGPALAWRLWRQRRRQSAAA